LRPDFTQKKLENIYIYIYIYIYTIGRSCNKSRAYQDFGGSKACYTFIHPAKPAESHGRTYGQLGAIGASLDSGKPAAYGPDYWSFRDDGSP
jgi:hypothetical protein